MLRITTLTILGVAAAFAVWPSPASGQEEECIDCNACYGSFGWGHKTFPYSQLANNSEGEHGSHDTQCKTGPCQSEHPPVAECSNGQEDQEEVEALVAALPAVSAALESGDLSALVRLAQAEVAGPRLSYLASRRAVQIIGCNGSVVAHIPVDQELTHDAVSSLLALTSVNALGD